MISLQTGTANPSLSLGDFRGVGMHVHAAQLHVVSGAYQAQLRFTFDDEVFVAFIADLSRMDREQHGKTRLRELRAQEPYLAFEVTDTGTVEVSGVLLDWEHRVQRLVFQFSTSSSVLTPFANALSAARDAQIARQTGDEV